MAFCPFYDLQCPETNVGTGGCAIWTDFGCCMIDKPGIPAEFSGVEPSIDVYILKMFCGSPKDASELLIIYSKVSDGEIGTSDTLSDFTIHNLD